ncbi:MAG: lysozyme [Bacteroidaceae bacterium]|nr:lysozyme [Bacteroidaceae bacterium]
METSERGVDMIIAFEGMELNAYKCPAGVWTIGVGHTGEVDGIPVKRGMLITQAQAKSLLREDLSKAERYINRQSFAERLTQGMFDALVSFIFNVGTGAFQTSTMRKCLCTGDFEGAVAQFGRWIFGTVNGKKEKLAGLVARREREKEWFLNG